MPGLEPGIHVFLDALSASKSWMAGTSPAMTMGLCLDENLSPDRHVEAECVALRRIRKRPRLTRINALRNHSACKRVDEIIGPGALGRHSFDGLSRQARLDQQLPAQCQPWLVRAALHLLRLDQRLFTVEPPERHFGMHLEYAL